MVDTDHAFRESGDIRIPLEKGLLNESGIIRLGEVINETKALNIHSTTFFKTVGMALFDLLTAEIVYKKAVEKNIGTTIDFS